MATIIETGGLAKIVPWDCEGIESPYGWSSVDNMSDGRSRFKGRKSIDANTDAVILERLEIKGSTITDEDLGTRIYYKCWSKSGRLFVDSRFLEAV